MSAAGLALTQLADGPQPYADRDPLRSYLLTGLAVVLIYVASRVDTDSSSARRRSIAAGLLGLGTLLLLVGLAVGVGRGP